MSELATSTRLNQPTASASAVGPFRWSVTRDLLLLSSIVSAAIALFCLYSGFAVGLRGLSLNLLLAALLGLNIAPPMAELFHRRFDPFDLKHLFLAYFFVILTLPCVYGVIFELTLNPLFNVPSDDPSLRIRALAAIVLGMSAFVAGCYLPFGNVLGVLSPQISSYSRKRVATIASLGVVLGFAAFFQLMRSAGGISSFLTNLGAWRTNDGVSGSGYLTFPIAYVLPGSALLLMLAFLPAKGRRITWASLLSQLLAIVSLSPLVILGFRGLLVPALLQFFAVWHYARHRFHFRLIIELAVLLPAALMLYGEVRARAQGERVRTDFSQISLLYRVPGLDTVERVFWQLDRGEPHLGVKAGFKEAATILIPRSLWLGKPDPASLAFADIFFYDFYIGRGDPIDGVKSGMSPTVVGEPLWIAGIPGVALAGFLLGTCANALSVWRRRGPDNRLTVFIYTAFATRFAMFVEAPQNTLNSFVMLSLLIAIIWVASAVNFGGGLSRKTTLSAL